jgi:deoxyribonuclease V
MLGPHKVGYEIVLQEIEEPVYVSVGNRLGLDEAVGLVLKASPFFRLPEPLRQAELEAKKIESAWH